MAAPLVNLVLASNCHVCGEQLRRLDRIPVCDRCLCVARTVDPEYSCAACQAAFLSPKVLDEEGLCRMCRAGGFAFASAHFHGYFQEPIRRLIHLFKYEGVATLDGPLSGMLYEAWPKEIAVDMVVPMPLHWERQMHRGYNQSELLAEGLAERINVPVYRALRRQRATQALAEMGAKERRREIAGAFVFAPGMDVKGKRIVLIDDVFTTGSTANAAAKVLREGGAHVVHLLTLARVDRRPMARAGVRKRARTQIKIRRNGSQLN